MPRLTPLKRQIWEMEQRRVPRHRIARTLGLTLGCLRVHLSQIRRLLGIAWERTQRPLSDRQRRILTAREQGVSCRDLAERFSTTETVIRSTICRARKRLGLMAPCRVRRSAPLVAF